MRPTVPTWFANAVKGYDGALRLRWSDHSRQFVLERRISNTPAGALDKLKGVLQEIASKPVKDLPRPDLYIPAHVWEARQREHAQTFARRIGCLDRLGSLNDGYHFIFWVPPPLTQYLLDCVLFTLKETDVWDQGGADKMSAGMDYEDTLAERRLERSKASDHHDMAALAFMHSQALCGERVAAFNPTSRKGVLVG